jgi:hypothetical protein
MATANSVREIQREPSHVRTGSAYAALQTTRCFRKPIRVLIPLWSTPRSSQPRSITETTCSLHWNPVPVA